MDRIPPDTAREFAAVLVTAVVVVGFASSAVALGPLGSTSDGSTDAGAVVSTPTATADATTPTATDAPTRTDSGELTSSGDTDPTATAESSTTSESATATPATTESTSTSSTADTSDASSSSDGAAGGTDDVSSESANSNDGANAVATRSLGDKPPEGISSGVAQAVSGDSSTLRTQSTSGDTIEIRIHAAQGQADAALAAVENRGGHLHAREDDRLVVEVPTDAIETLRTHAAVEYIQLPDRPRLPAGAITSEGIYNMSADDLHAEGVTGDDVTVAVIDLDAAHSPGGGFNATNPEIADNVVDVHDPTTGETFTNGSDRHGTGVAEVVVDTAPNASLVLLETQNEVEIEDSIDYARTNADADVIVMSLGYSTGPFDGTGPIGDNIQAARDAGIPMFISSGNAGGGKHLNVTWSDPDDDDFLEFAPGDDSLDVSTQASFVSFTVSWNDYPGSANDYDIAIFNASGVVASSVNVQSGTQPPEEAVATAASNCPCWLQIQNFSSDGTGDFDVFVNDGTTLEYSTNTRSVTRPATDEASITVGAIKWDTLQLEDFSSRGPTIDGRMKPEISAPDAVTTDSLGTFFGTSAAAPHAAGVAALLQEANTSITPSKMQSVMQDTARQTDSTYTSPDPNNQTGHGLINASAAYDSMRPLLDQQWTHDTGAGTQFAEAAVDSDRVYAGGLDSTLTAINRSTGAVDWQFERSGALADSSPALANGQVFVGSGGGSIYALDAATGSVNWNTTTQSAVVSSPAVSGGSVYVGLNNGSILALDESTGSVQWHYEGDGPVYSTLDVAGGNVYASLNNGTVLALDPATGSTVWSFHANTEVGHASPISDGGPVYFVADEIYSLDVGTGAVNWQVDFNGTAGSSPVLANGILYVGGQNGTLHAVDTNIDDYLWNYSAGAPIRGQPVAISGKVIVASTDGTVHLVDQDTGAANATAALGGTIYASPAAMGDDVYVGSESGVVYALENLL